MARPSKLTAEVQQRIVDAIAAGNYMETAAHYAGIHKDTLYEWLKRGRAAKKGDETYTAFAQAVEEALARAEIRDVALIARAAEHVWQAAAWRLERRYPEKWGRRKVELEHIRPDKEPIELVLNFDHRSGATD